jgi:beta-lactamase regulating signal transducer with metallopeptidase domain/biopolymer transport protein ExbD
MNTLILLAREPWLTRLGWVLIHFLWQGAAVGMILAALLSLLNRASAQVRYLVICLAFLACAIAPLATWAILARQEKVSFQAPAASAGELDAPAIRPAQPPPGLAAPTQNSAGELSAGAAQPGPKAPWYSAGLRIIDKLLPYAVVIWFCGVLLLTARLAFGWAGLQRLRQSGTEILDAAFHERFRQLIKRMRVSEPVRLLQSALVEVPTVIGWLRPVILLPASIFSGLTPDQIEAVLAHELAHIRRCDYLVNLIQTLIETVLFYHPAIWWMSSKLREEREVCCDDIAIGTTRDRVVYASALATLEESRACASPLALAATGQSLLLRIRRIAGADCPKSSPAPLVALLLIVTGLIATMEADTPAKSISPAEPFAALTRQLADEFRQVRSVEYFSIVYDPRIEKTVQFAGQGDKFEFDFHQLKSPYGKEMDIHDTWDGPDFPIDKDEQVRITTKLSNATNGNGFLMPYEFLRFDEQGEFVEERYIGVNDMANVGIWSAAASRAKDIHLEKLGNLDCVVATFAGLEALDHNPVSFMVWFSVSQGGFPVKWKMQIPKYHYAEEYDVTNLQRVNLNGSSIYYPMTAVFRQHTEGGQWEPTVSLQDVHFNRPLEEGAFTSDRVPVDPAKNPAVVTLRSDGSLFFDRHPIAPDELVARMRELARLDPDQAVILRADQNVNYKIIVNVLNLFRQANISNVAFASQFDSATKAPSQPAPSPVVVTANRQIEGDVGRLYHAMVYTQTSAEAPKLGPTSYQFIADMSNTQFPVTSSLVSLPAGSAWATDPVAIATPDSLCGAHYLFVQGFKSEGDLMANFPNGSYEFDVQAGPTGAPAYKTPVSFTGAVSYPPIAPVITNTTWDSGSLVLDPASAVINFTNYPGATLTWEIFIPGRTYIMSAGSLPGGQPSAGSLNLTGLLNYGQTYEAQLRFITRDGSSTVSDPNSPKDYGFSTMVARIVEFKIKTPPANASASLP